MAFEEFQNLGIVVVAAGSGQRFGARKQFAPLAGKPLLAYCLEAFDAIESIAARVVVLPRDAVAGADWKAVQARLRHGVTAVAGGRERADSVRAGVEALPGLCSFVAVHDGARPFPPIEAMAECLATLKSDESLGAAIVCSPVMDTLKALGEDGRTIQATIDRRHTVRAETPQVCRVRALSEVLQAKAGPVTDEGQALEQAGWKTVAVVHHAWNGKITTPGDIRIAEAILSEGAPP